MKIILAYILSFAIYYLVGLVAAWLFMSIGVIMIVKNVFERDLGEIVKQFSGSLAWGIIGYIAARGVFMKILKQDPSIWFLIFCCIISILGSSVASRNHKPLTQVLGSILAGITSFLLFYY